MSDMFKTWWKSIMFKANFMLLYWSFESLSSWLTRSFLLYISSRNNFFWHRLYVKEVRKVALATLKRKNLGMTLWSSQIFRNWRSRRAFLCLISVFWQERKYDFEINGVLSCLKQILLVLRYLRSATWK